MASRNNLSLTFSPRDARHAAPELVGPRHQKHAVLLQSLGAKCMRQQPHCANLTWIRQYNLEQVSSNFAYFLSKKIILSIEHQ